MAEQEPTNTMNEMIESALLDDTRVIDCQTHGPSLERQTSHRVDTELEVPHNSQEDSQSSFMASSTLSKTLKTVSGSEIFRMLSPFQKAQIQQIFGNSSRTDSSCPFLEVFPPEIRNMIYSYLLVNPELGKASSVRKVDHYGRDASYGLVPQILCTCKQIYEECIPVLYEQNHFLIECLELGSSPLEETRTKINISPLTRYLHDVEFPTQHERPLLDDIAILKYVKHWKVVISFIVNGDERHADGDFARNFCCAICSYLPKSIEVLIIPEGVEKKSDVSCYNTYTFRVQEFGLFLRNIETLIFRPAMIDEIPDEFIRDGGPENQLLPVSPWTNDFTPTAWLAMRSLDDDPVFEYTYPKYQQTLEYAQTFERIPEFKKDMAATQHDTITGQNISIVPKNFDGTFGNPFKGSDWHPVESLFFDAAQMMTPPDHDTFKTLRHSIIEYLEPQYQRIATAANNVNQFVKIHKNRVLVSFPNSCAAKPPYSKNTPNQGHIDTLAEILNLVTDYTAAFERDVSPEVQATINEQQIRYDARFDILPRAEAFRRLNYYFNYREWYSFVDTLRFVIDDCDKQYLEIRNARKRLFKWDRWVEKRGCDIDVGLNMLDEMVQWEVEEPDIGPELEGNETRDYTSQISGN